MMIFRWLGAMVLAGSVGCNSTGNNPDEGTAANPPDGSAGGDSSTPGDGGAPSDANVGDAGSTGCVTGSVTFVVTSSPGNTSGYCLGEPGTCSNQWLSIRPAGGGTLALDSFCQTPCQSCQAVACPGVCAVPSPLGDGGTESTWDGTYALPGTCGAGSACVSQGCAPPGNYVATFCGYAQSPDASAFGCTGAATPTCVETPFVWPPPSGSPPVQGVLGTSAADAGSCCPVGWDLSTCTFMDGGAGQQCHNPALGCASSTTCGQGCDSVVTGRCDGQ